MAPSISPVNSLGAHQSRLSDIIITDRNQVILSVIGVPGALLAGWMVELPILGRRGTLAISTLFTGVFILASTTARTSNALLGWNCGYSFTSNIMYGVLYALSPELFPTKDRGTGNATVASANRVFGIMVLLSSYCTRVWRLIFWCRHRSSHFTPTCQQVCRSSLLVLCSLFPVSFRFYCHSNLEERPHCNFFYSSPSWTSCFVIH